MRDSLFLLAYAFIANVALAVVPHEPLVIWYGAHRGVLGTALIATAGTVAAAWTDHRLFAAHIGRLTRWSRAAPGAAPALAIRWFGRAPFAVLALSGITPLPSFPFKLLVFAVQYPRHRYIAAIAAGRLPRYLLLAWLGRSARIPAWALAAAGILLLLPTLRLLRCTTPNAN